MKITSVSRFNYNPALLNSQKPENKQKQKYSSPSFGAKYIDNNGIYEKALLSVWSHYDKEEGYFQKVYDRLVEMIGELLKDKKNMCYGIEIACVNDEPFLYIDPYCMREDGSGFDSFYNHHQSPGLGPNAKDEVRNLEKNIPEILEFYKKASVNFD